MKEIIIIIIAIGFTVGVPLLQYKHNKKKLLEVPRIEMISVNHVKEWKRKGQTVCIECYNSSYLEFYTGVLDVIVDNDTNNRLVIYRYKYERE